MKAGNSELEKNISGLQDSNQELKNYVSEVRTDVRAENERLMKKFEIKNLSRRVLSLLNPHIPL
jgi:Tfp pilus assembly protein PilP